VRLIPPVYVKPYVKRGNNDAADAAAIEPRPWRGEPMRFVPVNSAKSQAALMLHTTRERLDQAADHERQRLAWSSFRIRHDRRHGDRTLRARPAQMESFER
jgi:transposase